MNLVFISAGFAGTAIFALLMMVRSLISSDRRLGARMETYLGSATTMDMPAHSSDAESELAERLNRRLARLSIAERLQRDLEQANVPLTVSEYILLKIAAVLLPVGLVLLVSRSLLAAPIVGFIGYFLPTLWLRQRQRQRRQRFEQQLPETVSSLVSSLQAGFSLVQSLGNVAREAPDPTSAEIRRVVQEIQYGISVEQALASLASRMENTDLELIISVLNIHSRVGGNLTDILRTISTTIRDRIRLHRDVQVITAQQRYASYVLGLLPVALTLILMVINPNYMLKIFQPSWLLCIPFGAVVMNVMGFLVIRRIVDIKV